MDGQNKLRPIDTNPDHYDEVYDVWKQRSNHLKEEMQWIVDQLSLLVKQNFVEISRNRITESYMNSLSIGSGAGKYYTTHL